jgi:hypothetical protein
VTPQAAIEAAELAEAEIRYRNQLGREMYQAGQRAGFQAGYEQAAADMAARWDQIARPVVHGIPYAELEERRWGPGGRAHFADPQPEIGGRMTTQPTWTDRHRLTAPEGAELTDPAADQLPVVLQLAKEAEAELEAG